MRTIEAPRVPAATLKIKTHVRAGATATDPAEAKAGTVNETMK